METELYKVEHGNDRGKILVGYAYTYEAVMRLCELYLNKIGFKSYYYRKTVYNGIMEIDYGSWSKFFYIERTDGQEMTFNG